MKASIQLLKSIVCLFIFVFLVSCSKDDGTTTPPIIEPEPLPTWTRVGLVGHWDFGGNADDLSTNANHGLISGATLTADRDGNANGAYQFDGIDDYINVGSKSALGFGGFSTYAISAWAKPIIKDNNNTFISKFDGGVSAGWYLQVTNEGFCRTYRNVSPWSTKAIDPVSTNTWHHFFAQYDGTDLYVYVDGELQAKTPFTSHTNDTRTNILIGASHSRGDVAGFYEGIIDDIRIYDRTLSETEITWLATH